MRASYGVAHARHLLGAHVGERVGRPLEEGLGHFASQLLDQLLEALAGLGGDEVVALERVDAAGRVVGLEVEGHAALGGHVAGDLLAALITRGLGLLDQVVDGGPLVLFDVVELAAQLGQAPVGVALGQHFRPAPAQLLEQVAQTGHLLAVGRLEARAQEAAQRVVEVTAGEQVVGQARQQVVGVEVGELLGAVPLGIVVADAHVCASPFGRDRYLRPR